MEKPPQKSGGPPFRVFVSSYGKDVLGKVVIVHPEWSFEQFLLKLGAKFEVKVTDVFLRLGDDKVKSITLLEFIDIW
jgi:hypothetical protein